MINIYKGAGERILSARVMRGYTRENLAELAEISPKFLYEIETGKKGFSSQTLYNLCVALHIDSEYVLTGKYKNSYDQRLLAVIEMFEDNKTEKLAEIIKYIYALTND